MAFTGFTTDKLVGLPPELFSEMLPQITLPGELKIAARVHEPAARAGPRGVKLGQLTEDKTLRRSRSVEAAPARLLAEGARRRCAGRRYYIGAAG
jgi:hypothetical protein